MSHQHMFHLEPLDVTAASSSSNATAAAAGHAAHLCAADDSDACGEPLLTEQPLGTAAAADAAEGLSNGWGPKHC